MEMSSRSILKKESSKALERSCFGGRPAGTSLIDGLASMHVLWLRNVAAAKQARAASVVVLVFRLLLKDLQTSDTPTLPLNQHHGLV